MILASQILLDKTSSLDAGSNQTWRRFSGWRRHNRQEKLVLRPSSWFALILCLVLSPFSEAAAEGEISPETKKVLLQMDRANQSLSDLTADVTETKVTIVVNDTSVSTGKLFYKREKNGSRTKLEYEKPELKTLLIDKSKVLVYEPKIKHLQEIDLGKDRSQEAFLITGIGQSGTAIAKSYDAKLLSEESLDGVKTSVLELKPKSERVSAMFVKIVLWVDQSRWIPIQTRLTESSGDYLTIRFDNMQLNPKLPDKTFKLNIPADVEKSSYRGQ
jgi:outer membrane lipoprotein-sorting protein